VCHISSEIVNEVSKEFDIESFATEEKMMLDNFVTESTSNPVLDPVLVDSTGPVTAIKMKKRKDTVSM
jgi:nuclear GTP-binding protein